MGLLGRSSFVVLTFTRSRSLSVLSLSPFSLTIIDASGLSFSFETDRRGFFTITSVFFFSLLLRLLLRLRERDRWERRLLLGRVRRLGEREIEECRPRRTGLREREGELLFEGEERRRLWGKRKGNRCHLKTSERVWCLCVC